MPEAFDVQERWPDLFEGLSERGRWAVVQALAAAWHEGWVPNRDDVELITDDARGAVSPKEFRERAYRAALRDRQNALAGR
ncbi:MAG: hypothetical protein LBJ08_04660 [Bifidobacteriaceae bacterium]|nr:hypothetical protein [Bifidobacteriaceae bacterium]